MLTIWMWEQMLYHYELWCYDLGIIAIDRLHRELNDYWESL